MAYIRKDLQPGIYRDSTRYAAEGLWYDCDHIRFREGRPEKLGGWQMVNGINITGVSRAIHGWNSLDGDSWVAWGTQSKLELLNGSSKYDITPVRSSSTVANPFNTTLNSSSVIVSITSHGAITSASVIFTTIASTIGGNVLIGGEYVITSVIGTDSFQITVPTSAAATSASTGGASVAYQFLINPGPQSNTPGYGWGAGIWGASTWGTARTTGSVVLAMRNWSLANFGENLLANPKSGALYQWIKASGTASRAVIVTAAPSVIDFMFVSQEDRHVVAIGTTDVSSGVYDPLLIRWSSTEDQNDWVTSATNTAGFFRLNSGNYTNGAINSRIASLIWTDKSLYNMSYEGAPYVFGIRLVDTNCGSISPHSMAEYGGSVYWMGQHNFFSYDGGGVKLIECPVRKYIYDRLDTDQGQKVFCGVNPDFKEVWWFYQSTSATGEIDSYVKYNIQESAWDYGSMARTSWLSPLIFQTPFATGSDSYYYAHEQGYDADTSAMNSWVVTGDFDIGDGTQIMYMDRVIPDFADLTGNTTLTMYSRKYPATTATAKGPYTVTTATNLINLRTRGRQIAYMIQSNNSGDFWRLGSLRFNISEDGEQ